MKHDQRPLKPALDFRHAHVHKCNYCFLGASKIFHPSCTCACKFLITFQFTTIVFVYKTQLVFSTRTQLRQGIAYGRGVSLVTSLLTIKWHMKRHKMHEHELLLVPSAQLLCYIPIHTLTWQLLCFVKAHLKNQKRAHKKLFWSASQRAKKSFLMLL